MVRTILEFHPLSLYQFKNQTTPTPIRVRSSNWIPIECLPFGSLTLLNRNKNARQHSPGKELKPVFPESYNSAALPELPETFPDEGSLEANRIFATCSWRIRPDWPRGMFAAGERLTLIPVCRLSSCSVLSASMFRSRLSCEYSGSRNVRVVCSRARSRHMHDKTAQRTERVLRTSFSRGEKGGPGFLSEEIFTWKFLFHDACVRHCKVKHNSGPVCVNEQK